jgi:hypothetical protein
MRVPVTDLFLVRSSLLRLLAHALAAWALCAVLLGVLLASFERTVASALFTLGAPALTGLIAALYFRGSGGGEPIVGAIGFTAVAVVLDALLAARVAAQLLDPAFGFVLPLLLVFGTTGLTGELVRPAHQGRACRAKPRPTRHRGPERDASSPALRR